MHLLIYGSTASWLHQGVVVFSGPHSLKRYSTPGLLNFIEYVLYNKSLCQNNFGSILIKNYGHHNNFFDNN